MSRVTHSLESLFDEYIEARKAVTLAERDLDDATTALMNAMTSLGQRVVDSREHHLSVRIKEVSSLKLTAVGL